MTDAPYATGDNLTIITYRAGDPVKVEPVTVTKVLKRFVNLSNGMRLRHTGSLVTGSRGFSQTRYYVTTPDHEKVAIARTAIQARNLKMQCSKLIDTCNDARTLREIKALLQP
jgi:hypothetical protein